MSRWLITLAVALAVLATVVTGCGVPIDGEPRSQRG